MEGIVAKVRKCSFKKIISFLFTGTLAAAFLGWSYFAVDKYLQQPLSTQITYTRGDNGTFIKYPLVTVCLHQTELDCLKGTHDFWKNILESCIADEEFNEEVESYINAPPKIVSGIALYLGKEFVELDSDESKKVLSTSFRENEGKCQTIDINKSSFNIGMITTEIPEMRLELTAESSQNTGNNEDMSWMKMFLHNEDDLLMADEMHPYFWIFASQEK